MLVGGLACGFAVAIMMANSGAPGITPRNISKPAISVAKALITTRHGCW
jgi:hypothetical protein